MSNLTLPTPDEAIISCDQEAIHHIAEIQPHGYLICISRSDHTLTHVSENIADLLGEQHYLNTKLTDLKGELESDLILDLLKVQYRNENKGSNNPYALTINGKSFNLITYHREESILLEFEPKGLEEEISFTQRLLGEALLDLSPNNTELGEILQKTTKHLSKLLGYDRVMVYKFWDDWHGEIIAETKLDDQESFLGLHYPATDIPEQARKLYAENLTRLIADVEAEPVKILSNRAEPLDIGMSQLRSVSRVHIEYLQNMGVAASYSISLMSNGKLWGLIACHNSKAQFLDFEKRKSSEVIAHFLGSVLDLKENQVSEENNDNSAKALVALEDQMRQEWDVVKGLCNHQMKITDVNDCHGAALVFDNQIVSIGHCPQKEEIKTIVAWLNKDRGYKKVFHTANLIQFIPDAKDFVEKASGLLAVTLSEELKEYILWFKPEQITKVSWAGKKDKLTVQEENGTIRFSPRKSFAKWVEEVRYTSEVWKPWEIKAAKDLRGKVNHLIQLKANEIRRLNAQLNTAYDELDSFSYTLSHDLKTPLNTIRGYIELLMEDLGEEEVTKYDAFFSKVLSNTELMTNMISSILKYSKMSREDLKFEEVKILPVIEQIVSQLEIGKQFKNVKVEIDKDLVVFGDETMLYQVFLNLMDNAVKYSRDTDGAEVKVVGKKVDANVEISVIDNGMGIESQYFENIFNLFSRIPTKKQIQGTGIGLSIAKRVVEKHKGSILVSSELGKGTIFTVKIPESQT